MEKHDPAPLRILVAPLDWGLGHATRCIPLIRQLLHRGCDVWIASEGRTQQLLQQEFPSLTHIALRGYRVRYAASRLGLAIKITAQIPRILQTVRYEKHWLRQVAQEFGLDAVVSDNRFGLRRPGLPCVFLTHQLRIKAPFGSLVQKLNYRFINRFDSCWVPDAAGEPNLSGSLGHPKRLPSIPVHYLGVLSRLEPREVFQPIKLVFLLSGPEPQRTLFEKQILHQLANTGPLIPGAVLIRGLPGGGKRSSEMTDLVAKGKLVVYDHLPANPLEEVLSAAEWVVARTGYTTVMDLVHLRKKSILVPTPGQTEQEYLAGYLRENGIACTFSQAGFSLEGALREAAVFPYTFPRFDKRPDDVIDQWLEDIRAAKA